LPLGLQKLQDEVDQRAQVLHGLVVDEPLAVGLIEQLGVLVAADVDEADDLIVAEPLHGIVDAPLVQPQPAIARLAARPDASHHGKC
jgi:hypothetical protein